MSLIKCPECGKEISDKSEKCIHCGFPISSMNNNANGCTINGVKYDLSNELNMIKNNVGEANIIRELRMKCNISLLDARTLYNNMKYSSSVPKTLVINPQQSSNIPHCPYCQSTNLKRITATAKATNIALFGIFGNKRKYQWHCNNCKSDF